MTEFRSMSLSASLFCFVFPGRPMWVPLFSLPRWGFAVVKASYGVDPFSPTLLLARSGDTS